MDSVQAKLLAMLVVLSLPLLAVSLILLEYNSRTMSQQSAALATSEAFSASTAIESWLSKRDNSTADNPLESPRLQTGEISELYAGITARLSTRTESVIIVFDERGNVIPDVRGVSPTFDAAKFQAAPATQKITWSDGITRMTSVIGVAPYNWSVAVGLTPTENTPAGRAALLLTLTWALALAASILLAVWATSRFTNPLRRLAAAATVIGEGRLQERVPVETRDEVGTLAGALNTMAADLENRFVQTQAQSAFISEVLDSLPLGIAVIDDKLSVLQANPMFRRFIGRAHEKLDGRRLYDAAEGLRKLRDVIDDVRRTRQPFVTYGLPLALTPILSDDTPKPDNTQDETAYWDIIIWSIAGRDDERSDLILILSEVSKRVRAESLATRAFAAERTRANELSSVINQMHDGVVIVDKRGRYRVNPAGAQILGRERDEFRDSVDALIEDFNLRWVTGDAVPSPVSPLRRALENGETTTNERFKIERPNGEERVISISVTPLIGEQGTREGLIAVFHDATEEVRGHIELVEAYERLREHDRLKSVFFNKVSHELRTPLNVILGVCQLLGRDAQAPLTSFQNDSVERMERNARSLLKLVNDLLDYSRLEAGRVALEIEQVDVEQVIAETVKSFAGEAEAKKLELRFSVAPEAKIVFTDRRKLERITANLISNAIKFTMSGGVYIRATAHESEHWILEVRDTGIGMTMEEQSFIFDEFRQVDDRLARSFGGIGLGLAITNKIVALLGGTLSVTSVIGEGSTFRIVWLRHAQPRTGTGSLIPVMIEPQAVINELAPKTRLSRVR
ncbi:MAG: ATP-binding protein [Pyrinomonadaceae bacterium MAG19_C2-C3]|nr:ATP-binding protein [Pyrinomonadaceae bacterium MAG19_C2-C3]